MRRHALPAAAAALLVAAAVAAAIRAGRRPPPPPEARAPAPLPVESAVQGTAAPDPGPVRAAARRGVEALLDVRARREAHRTGGTPLDETALKAREEEAAAAAADLGALLGKEPARWTEVFEVLAPLGDLKAALRIGEMLAPFVDDAAEPRVLEGLRSGPGPAARRAAVAMLRERSSPEVLRALLAAAQEDPDSGVRYEALLEAHRRKPSAPSEELKALVEEAVRRRSLAEPDPNVRAQVDRLLPGTAPGGPAPPPRRPGGVFRRLPRPSPPAPAEEGAEIPPAPAPR